MTESSFRVVATKQIFHLGYRRTANADQWERLITELVKALNASK